MDKEVVKPVFSDGEIEAIKKIIDERDLVSDDDKEEMKKLIAQAEHERIGRLDKMLHSRSKAKKK